MALGAMRFTPLPLSGDTSPHILKMSDWLQMVWVYTGSIPAEVI